MDLIQVVVLALIQGLTEFLPISSSAHLILPSQLFAWPDQGLAFDVAVHVGTLSAVMLYFRKEIGSILQGWLCQFGSAGQTTDSRLGWAIIVATIPVCIVGFFGKDIIETQLRSILVIAVTTIVFGLALWWADRSHKATRGLTELTLGLALLIGLSQVLALIPGTSRSGITMTAALLLGFTRTDSAKFSFLISIPTILLGGGLATFELLGESGVDWVAMFVGFSVSAVSAYICIYFFLAALERIGMFPFVVYRLILGTALFLIWAN